MEKEPKNLDISKLENVERPIKNEENNQTCNLLMNVELEVSAILGETQAPLKKILDLTKGSIIELDSKANEEIKLLANGEEVARGQVVIIEDNFGIRITKTKENKQQI